MKAHNLLNEPKFLPGALANPPLVSVLCLLFFMDKIYNLHPVSSVRRTVWYKLDSRLHPPPHLIYCRCNPFEIITPLSREGQQGCQEGIRPELTHTRSKALPHTVQTHNHTLYTAQAHTGKVIQLSPIFGANPNSLLLALSSIVECP